MGSNQLCRKNSEGQRTGDILRILSPDTYEILYTHQVDWSKHPNSCIGQWAAEPEEFPTQKVTSILKLKVPEDPMKRFERFSVLNEGGQNDS